MAVGFWAAGGFALGCVAFGGVAVAWKAAMGGVALAKHIAMGGVASALQANTELAEAFVNSNGFLLHAQELAQYSVWLTALCLMPLALLGWHGYKARQNAN